MIVSKKDTNSKLGNVDVAFVVEEVPVEGEANPERMDARTKQASRRRVKILTLIQILMVLLTTTRASC